jgi:uncharacterized membrane protein YccC
MRQLERRDVPPRPYCAVASAIVALWREFAELEFSGPRAAQAYMAALVVAIAVGTACAMHLPEVWWSAISGFISTQTTRPASLEKGLLRIAGTATGAALSVALVGWLAYDQLAGGLALLIVSSIGILAVNVSPHWLCMAVLQHHFLFGAADVAR